MFPFKKFIKGPNLHEESLARNYEKPKVDVLELTGDEAKQVYEEILSTNSNSSKLGSNLSKNHNFVEPSSSSSSVKILKSKPPKLNLNQLMKLCESNNYKKLCEYIEEYQEEQDFDVDEIDIYGWTLLMSAACEGALECLKLLLEAGANWKISDKKGFTAYSLAKRKGRHEACSILDEWIDYCSNPSAFIMNAIEEESERCIESNEPIHCDACNMNFSNQKEHLKSIAHLVSSGEMKTDGKIHFGIPESNKGFQMMLKTGWNKSSGLGPDGIGQKFPIKTVLKRNRHGVGNEKDKNAARITHFGPFDPAAIENPKRLENINTLRKREDVDLKRNERRKEIKIRRELNSL